MTTPDKHPLDHRFFRLTQSAYYFGFIGHSVIALVFYLLEIRELFWFNIVISIPFFLIAIVANKKGRYNLAFSLAFLELYFHQVACVFYLGWVSGFQYMLIYLAGLTFFNSYWRNWLRLLLLSLVLSTFTLLYFIFRDFQVYYLSELMYDIFYLSNSLGSLTSLAFLINYYVQNAMRAEKKLAAANRELEAAYKEVNHQKSELEVRNDFIKKTFGRYLSDDIVARILDTPEGLELRGETRKVTILMSDLRGFTQISEQLPSEKVLSFLNNFFTSMTEVILKYNGTIDEFIGDAILVIFGAPFSKQDDTERAVACALEMQKAMEKVNLKNRQQGYPEIEMGIGINTGDVVVGNIGSDKRSKYGVVGINVNLTSRIESYTVGGQILIAESTYRECKHLLNIDKKMEVLPKGVKAPISIYSVIGMDGKFNIHL